MREIYRILDANFNRAREALRVIEDCGRFVLNDPAITAMAKHFRSDIKELLDQMPQDEIIASRDTAGDIGTDLTSPAEPVREDIAAVVTAACKRLTESLRTIEEYCKIVANDQGLAVERMRYDAYTLEQRVAGRFLNAEKFRNVHLYAMLSASLCSQGSLRDVARSAIAGGADAIQLREKDTPDSLHLAMAAELRELTDETGTLLIINDRPDIATIVGADGVHLGQNDLPVRESRRLLRPDAIIGRSCHSIKEARDAINEGADYVALGPMFATTTKSRPPVGPGLLDEFSQAFTEIALPVVAIGGINAENVGDLIARGARIVACCGSVNCAEDPQAAARAIKDQLVAARKEDEQNDDRA
ncbi:MAG: thiamine phosphate synthase [Planctomycetes bacterium]|jgi:thiamine-phosphate pyrophosphorylase|nr:thiamine phosphate synthase [Planctomycetota bacterium]